MIELGIMKKTCLSQVLAVLFLNLTFVAGAQSVPESIRENTLPLKDCYAPYFSVGAASFADGKESAVIKANEKAAKERDKAASKSRKGKKAGKGQAADLDGGENSAVQAALKKSDFVLTVEKHFAELSTGNELLPATLLGERPRKLVRFTASDGYVYEVPEKINTKYIELFLNEALAAGVQVRFHLLVCPEVSPEWFFFRNYDSALQLVGKDEMSARLEWYIKSVTDYVSDWEYQHNGGKILVSSYDVVSELFTDSGDLNLSPFNYLMKIFGDVSYASKAFVFAAKCVPSGVKLCYCDHSLFEEKKALAVKEFVGAVRSAGDRGRVDEIGVISHLTALWPERSAFFDVCREFSGEGFAVQIQQLDIAPVSGVDTGMAYFDFMKLCVENAAWIKGVSFRAVNAVEETEFVDYMRTPLFAGDFSCTDSFDMVVAAVQQEVK